MIYALAKSEIRTGGDINSFMPALNERVQKICERQVNEEEGLFFEDKDLFPCCLFMAVAVTHKQPALATHLFQSLLARSQLYLQSKADNFLQADAEDVTEREVSLKSGDKALEDSLVLIDFVLRKGLFKSDLLDQCDGSFTVSVLHQAFAVLQEFVKEAETRPFIQLTQFAPKALWFEIFATLMTFRQKKQVVNNVKVQEALKQLVDLTFQVFAMYKRNSKYYLVKTEKTWSGNSVAAYQDKEIVRDTQPDQTRRMSTLFTDILDLLVQFCCSFLKTMEPEQCGQAAQNLFALLFEDENDDGFTAKERLSILNELNFVFQAFPQITERPSYWKLVKEGLSDYDQSCRKLSLTVLKSNLKLVKDPAQSFGVGEEEFELLWTTFFDVYDTLESFGSHLTKALWHRVELFYEFMKKNDELYTRLDTANEGLVIHHLADFRGWLLVLYQRVGSHMNTKIRRYVQKTTLKREFITVHFFTKYFMGEFQGQLSYGLIFKDASVYTQYSTNTLGVYNFYKRFFDNESRDISNDLRQLWNGFRKYVTHHQQVMVTMRLLSTDFTDGGKRDIRFIGNQELSDLLPLAALFCEELWFSNRYLCYKFILKLLALYLDTSQELDWSTLFKCLGKLPVELFSRNCTYDDKEGLEASQRLVTVRMERAFVQQLLATYLDNLFTVKAMTQQMSRFGADADLIINGMVKLIVTMDQIDSEQTSVWLQQAMGASLEAIDAALASTYMATKLVDQKVHNFALICDQLHTYGTDRIRETLREVFLIPRLGAIMSRYEQSLATPLAREEGVLLSEQDKVDSIIVESKAYITLLKLSIQMVHLHMNQNNNAIETAIKHILNRSLKVTSSQREASQENWNSYLLQHVTLEALQGVCESYAKGIKEALRAGKSTFFVPEDLFTIGKPILQNLIAFAPQRKANGLQALEQNMQNFMIDLNWNQTKITQNVSLNGWKAMSDLTLVFQFDATLAQELTTVYNSQITDKAIDFLSSTTEDYNECVFTVLKVCYVPAVIQKLNSGDNAPDVIAQFQFVAQKCWTLIKNAKTDVEPASLVAFMELIFGADLMESYRNYLLTQTEEGDILLEFHRELAYEMIEHANRYWLIMRSLFNQLMFTFATRPYLMSSFETFIVKFGVSREIRSLDSEIKLYKLTTMLPECIPKKYEKLSMDEVTYQGAYIRTMTCLIIEGLVKNCTWAMKDWHDAKKRGEQVGPLDPAVLQVAWSVERIMRALLHVNFELEMKRSDQKPYSEPHRQKVRCWQMILVCQQLLDPEIYTEELRAQSPDGDIVLFLNKKLWDILKMNHLPTVRMYMEIFAVKFVLAFPDITLNDPEFVKTLLDPNIRQQVSGSLLQIAGYILLSELNTADVVAHKRKIFEHFVGFSCSNSAHCRCTAHYFLIKLQADKQFGRAFMPTSLLPLLEYLERSKDVQRMMTKIGKMMASFEKICFAETTMEAILSEPIDGFGEFLREPFVQGIKDVISETMTEHRKNDDMPIERKDYWKHELARRQKEENFTMIKNESSSQNYQRKILPWDVIEFDVEVMKRQVSNRKRNEIIMCASLIDKIPNLAGLARTSEIMNASSLVINNKNVCETDEFKGISVTSEKWLPIYEVREHDLLDYLAFQKSNGFSILGLEQTANSKMLHDFKFPQKSIMLLGKEKEGIPQEYYGIIDYCIEIPQFGIIRSLNVHVSGALCLWEYTKQQIPAGKPTPTLAE